MAAVLVALAADALPAGQVTPAWVLITLALIAQLGAIAAAAVASVRANKASKDAGETLKQVSTGNGASIAQYVTALDRKLDWLSAQLIEHVSDTDLHADCPLQGEIAKRRELHSEWRRQNPIGPSLPIAGQNDREDGGSAGPRDPGE